MRLDVLEAALEDAASVALVTMLWANNEVGTVQPVEEVARLTARAGVPLHIDAVAAYGQLPIDFHGVRRATDAPGGAGLVALSVSAHKIGGPAGIGALVLDRSAAVEPLIHGGGQQRKVRSGTQDVAAAAAFAARGIRRRRAARRRRPAHGGAARPPHRGCARRGARGAPLGRPRPRRHGCPATCTSRSRAARATRCSSCSTPPASRCRRARRARPACPSPRTCSWRWAAPRPMPAGALRITIGHSSTDADVDAFLAALPAAHAQAARAGLAARATSFDR